MYTWNSMPNVPHNPSNFFAPPLLSCILILCDAENCGCSRPTWHLQSVNACSRESHNSRGQWVKYVIKFSILTTDSSKFHTWSALKYPLIVYRPPEFSIPRIFALYTFCFLLTNKCRKMLLLYFNTKGIVSPIVILCKDSLTFLRQYKYIKMYLLP